MNAESCPGFYGKLPVLGDFVTRRLPRSFVSTWDQWLQGAIASSREQLGADWLDVYLTSPIWRFGLGPGICGETAWAGIMMPSVDKVGRYFPLTLAVSLAEAENLPHLFGPQGAPWFEELEQLALSGLEDGFKLETFDQRLQTLSTPRFEPVSFSLAPAVVRESGRKFAQRVDMESLKQTPAAFIDLCDSLMSRFMPLYSLWSTVGSDSIGVSLLVCEGLPPIDAYVALLTGYWAQRGWALQNRAVRVAATEENNDQDCDATASEATTRPRQPSLHWRWRSWGLSAVGKRRKINEDAMIERTEAGLWAVADGMGGHRAGDVASRTIVEELAQLELSSDLDELSNRVDQTLQEVNTRLCNLARESGEEDLIIGSTVVVLLAGGNRCLFLWAGDSRLYLFREGTLQQLTRDHSLFEDFASQGWDGAVALVDPPRCNIITRAVGANETLALSSGECEAQSGDLFLLCSDGLDKELTAEDIAAVFREHDREEIVGVLIEQAEARGARDNVTVVVVEVSVEER